ncbi:MAG: DegV family protein [Candidatus Villigracilaceae bacterium]
MRPIAVITDTDASLPLELAEKHKIRLVPIIVNFGEESYQAVYEIDDHAVFERINRDGRLPTTSAPAPGQFVEAYRQAFETGAESILCFTVSAEVSATYKAALAAKEEFPGRDIEVVDTRQLSISQGFMALAAAEAIEAGASKEEALARARQAGANAHLYAALPTLKYIAMSGRVSQVAAGIAGVLSIQPILSIKDGKLDLLEKARTRRRAWERVIELCAEAIGGKTVERFALLNVDAPEDAAQFEAQLRAALPALPKEYILAELTPGLSVHSGAGIVGAAFVTQG